MCELYRKGANKSEWKWCICIDLKFGLDKMKLESFELIAHHRLEDLLAIQCLYVLYAINLKAKMASVKHWFLLKCLLILLLISPALWRYHPPPWWYAFFFSPEWWPHSIPFGFPCLSFHLALPPPGEPFWLNASCIFSNCSCSSAWDFLQGWPSQLMKSL